MENKNKPNLNKKRVEPVHKKVSNSTATNSDETLAREIEGKKKLKRNRKGKAGERRKKRKTRDIETLKKSKTQQEKLRRIQNEALKIRAVRTSLKSILNPNLEEETRKGVMATIDETVKIINKITIETYNFIKLYLLKCIDDELNKTQHNYAKVFLPVIDKDFVENVMKVVCDRGKKADNKRGAKPSETTMNLKKTLNDFYVEYYSKTIGEKEAISYGKYVSLFSFVSNQIVTSLDNSIMQYYQALLLNFLECLYNREEEFKNFDKDQKRNFNYKMKQLRNKLMMGSNIDYSEKLSDHQNLISVEKLDRNIFHHLKSKPQDFLKSIIYMSRYMENKKYKLMSLIPLRTSLVPKSILLDTCTLKSLLINKNNYKLIVPSGVTLDELNSHPAKFQREIWSYFFDTQKSCFSPKSRYRFNYSIHTDGISSSILQTSEKENPNKKLYLDDLHDFIQTTFGLETLKLLESKNFKDNSTGFEAILKTLSSYEDLDEDKATPLTKFFLKKIKYYKRENADSILDLIIQIIDLVTYFTTFKSFPDNKILKLFDSLLDFLHSMNEKNEKYRLKRHLLDLILAIYKKSPSDVLVWKVCQKITDKFSEDYHIANLLFFVVRNLKLEPKTVKTVLKVSSLLMTKNEKCSKEGVKLFLALKPSDSVELDEFKKFYSQNQWKELEQVAKTMEEHPRTLEEAMFLHFKELVNQIQSHEFLSQLLSELKELKDKEGSEIVEEIQKPEKKKKIQKVQKSNSEKYTDDIQEEERVQLRKKKIVAIDPNKRDLLYMTTRIGEEEIIKMKYTQNMRCSQTQQRKKQKKINKLKKENFIKGKSVHEWEAELSEYTHKTMFLGNFIEYLNKKNFINEVLFPFYEGPLFRIHQWYNYINRRKSEDKLINNVAKTFGTPDEALIAIGDWDQKEQMKFHEPTKGKGFRQLFRRYGYTVLLVDEHKTSATCYECHSKIQSAGVFTVNKNPRSKETYPKFLNHRLLFCPECKVRRNRDFNSSQNIWVIASHHIAGIPKPNCFLRTKGE